MIHYHNTEDDEAVNDLSLQQRWLVHMNLPGQWHKNCFLHSPENVKILQEGVRPWFQLVYVESLVYRSPGCAWDEPHGGTKLSAARWARLQDWGNAQQIAIDQNRSKECIELEISGKLTCQVVKLADVSHVLHPFRVSNCKLLAKMHVSVSTLPLLIWQDQLARLVPILNLKRPERSAEIWTAWLDLAWGSLSTAALSDARYHLPQSPAARKVGADDGTWWNWIIRDLTATRIAPCSWWKFQWALHCVRAG